MGPDASGQSVLLETHVVDLRAAIEAALDSRLPAPPLCPPRIAEAMRYGVMGRGKRFRPLLTLAAAETVAAAASGGSPAALDAARELAMPAACAVEFIHSYSLIHDDLPAMDNDTLRRGRPTVHVAYGEALAVLAGDGLLAEAFSLLANEPDDLGLPHLADRKLGVLKRIGRALGPCGMLGGQAMDLAFVGRLPTVPGEDAVYPDERTLRDMHARKTGALISAAAAAGAIIAGGSPSQVAAIDEFASELGLAFQIVDDVLDVEGEAEVIGKTPGKDHMNRKPTYPAMLGVDPSRGLARRCVDRARAALHRGGVPMERLVPLAEWTVARCS